MHTHTCAILDISQSAYQEIRHLLDEAGYADQFHDKDGGEVIDMHGIAVRGNGSYLAQSASELIHEGEAMPDRHPGVQQLLQFFQFEHLPAHLQEASRPFAELAQKVADGPQNAETTAALRKLLEAKDCAVRAILAK